MWARQEAHVKIGANDLGGWHAVEGRVLRPGPSRHTSARIRARLTPPAAITRIIRGRTRIVGAASKPRSGLSTRRAGVPGWVIYSFFAPTPATPRCMRGRFQFLHLRKESPRAANNPHPLPVPGGVKMGRIPCHCLEAASDLAASPAQPLEPPEPRCLSLKFFVKNLGSRVGL